MDNWEIYYRIHAKNKNLLPAVSEKSGWEKGYLTSRLTISSQTPDTSQFEWASGYIKILPNTNYVFTVKYYNPNFKNQAWGTFGFYDENKQPIGLRIGGFIGYQHLDVITLFPKSPENARYIRVSFRAYTNSPIEDGVKAYLVSEKGQVNQSLMKYLEYKYKFAKE